MAGTIIADYIRTDANKLSLNVGNTTFATINAMGLLSNTGTTIIGADGSVNGATITANTIPTSAIATGAITAAKMYSGAVLQVVQTVKTDIFQTTSTSYVDVTGMSATITPTFSNSKILVMFSGAVGMSSSASGALRLLRDSTAIFMGDAASGYTQVSSANFYGGSADGNNNESGDMKYLDSPGTTSPITYKIQAASPQGSTLVLNSLGSNISGQTYSMRSAASLILMEIKG